LLAPRADFYASGLPGAADVLLLVEVADRSARYDREVKLPRYRQAGIREVWLVDLEHDRLLAYRDPANDCYQCVGGGGAAARTAACGGGGQAVRAPRTSRVREDYAAAGSQRFCGERGPSHWTNSLAGVGWLR